MNDRQPQKDHRTAELAKIHIAKAQLKIDDDTYRLMLREIGGADSAADLDERGRRAVLDHLAKLGFKAKTPRRAGKRPFAGKAPQSKEALLSKIGALLADAGRPWVYADGMVKRMFPPMEKVRFCEPEQLRKIVAALTYDQKRREKKGK